MAWKGLSNYFRGSSAESSTETSDNMASRTSSDSWIIRREETSFRTNIMFCGIVESVHSKRAATLVIAQTKNGMPLMWYDEWDAKKAQFGRVLLLVERLSSSVNGPKYPKETTMYDVLKEGEPVMVEIRNASQSPDNIYKYFANLAFKCDGFVIKPESAMASIRDPLRGVVDSMVLEAGVIRFGTYDGRIAKAVATVENVYYKGEKLKRHLPLGSVASVGTQVFLEVTKWNNIEVKQEWEKLLYKEGVIFRASHVWLKGDPKPSKSRGSERPQKSQENRYDKDLVKVGAGKCPGRNTSSQDNIFSGYHLTNLHAYYGIVETITSGISAVACTAHLNGKPLSWGENWFAKGVHVERVFIMADHVRPSKNDPEYLKGTRMKQILKSGDPLRIVVEPTEKRPDKCYKWFGKTCWKVDVEESEQCTIRVNSLPGHLCGAVESLISHSTGIINFKTYHDMPARAFFTHDSFYHDGKKIMKHLPLGSEVTTGTEVFLVVDKWNPNSNPNEQDQEMIQKNVRFRATLVWNRGSPKPDEGSYYERKDQSASGYQHQKQGFQQRGHFEKSHPWEKREGASEGAARNENYPRGGKNFTRGRGGRQGMRGRGRGGYRRQQHAGGGRNDSDCYSNCTEDSESNMSDLSNMSDFFGTMNFEENSREGYFLNQDKSATKYDKNRQLDNVQKPYKKNEKYGSSKAASHTNTDVSKLSSFCPGNPLDQGIAGTIISVEENWGLVQVDESKVHDFQPNAVLLYGLKLEGVPLDKLFHQGQSVKVYLKREKVSILEYGTPQLPNQMRQAVVTYCEMNSVPHSVRDMLENIMLRFGI